MLRWTNHAGKIFGVRVGVCITAVCLLSAVVFLKPSHECDSRTTRREGGGTQQTAAKDITLLSDRNETAYEMWLTTQYTLASSLLLSETNMLEYATLPLGIVRTHASILGGLAHRKRKQIAKMGGRHIQNISDIYSGSHTLR